ncbi:hypothetical protein B0I33_11311 [Prauserella shujinwangii]|uniref:Uncharacterized protein n=1 Tax=Prauserella shujinwangii TaxID=1453103 RepID=A0A2T0LLI1_9PSEU|nr:hypothetical protein [Prauserella shujinwangii]PRX43848.1 hypothetical protein B0I33_11311 [Prauserella shujinwangii]
MSKNKNVLPMPTGSSAKPKIIGTLVTLGLLVFVVKYPGEAAEAAKGLLGMFETVVEGIAGFIRQLA